MSNFMMFWRTTGLDRRQRSSDTSHPFGVRAHHAPTRGHSREELAAFRRALRRNAPVVPFASPKPH